MTIMDWKHASMEGNLTWVRSTLTSSSSTGSVTLYAELSPTLIVGLSTRGGAPVDYVKFSAVTSAAHDAPNTVKLHLGGAAGEVSLIAPDAKECIQWLDAINLALSSRKRSEASATRSAPEQVVQQDQHQPKSFISATTTGTPVLADDIPEWRSPRRGLRYAKDESPGRSAGCGGTTEMNMREKKNGLHHAEKLDDNDTKPTQQVMVNSVYPAISQEFSGVDPQDTERTLPPCLARHSAFLQRNQTHSIVGDAHLHKTAEPDLKHMYSASDIVRDARDTTSFLTSGIPQRREIFSPILVEDSSHVEKPTKTEKPSTIPLKRADTCTPAFSMVSHDDYGGGGGGRCAINLGSGVRRARLISPDPPRGLSLTDNKIGRKLFGPVFLPDADGSSPPNVTSKGGGTDEGTSRNRVPPLPPPPPLPSSISSFSSLLHLDSAPRGNPVRCPLEAPASQELLSCDRGVANLPQRETATPRVFRCDRLTEGKSTNIDTINGMARGATRMEEMIGVPGTDEVITDSQHRDRNGISFHSFWKSASMPGLPLGNRNRAKISSTTVFPHEGGKQNDYNNSDYKTNATFQRVLADSIIDRIIRASPRNGSHENHPRGPPAAALSHGIDSRPKCLSARENDNYYRPIEAAVAVVPRRSASRTTSGGLLRRSRSMDSGLHREVNDNSNARNRIPLILHGVKPSLQPNYTPSNKRHTPSPMQEYAHRSDSPINFSFLYRGSPEDDDEYRYDNGDQPFLQNEEERVGGDVGAFKSDDPSHRLLCRSTKGGCESSQYTPTGARQERKSVKSQTGVESQHSGALSLMKPTLYTKHSIHVLTDSKQYVCMTQDGEYVVCIPAEKFEMRHVAAPEKELSSLEEVMRVYGKECRAMRINNIHHVSLGAEEEWTRVLHLKRVDLNRVVCIVSHSHAFFLEASSAAKASDVVEEWRTLLMDRI